MSLQWVQVDQGGLVRGRMLGRLLGIGDHAGIGLAVTYWSWALEMAPIDEAGIPDLRGLISDFDAVPVGIGWPAGEAEKLRHALVLAGLLQLQPLRVRGLSRYGPYFSKKLKDAERHRRRRELPRSPRDVPETSREFTGRGEESRREEIRSSPPSEEKAKTSVADATSPPPPVKSSDTASDVYATGKDFFGEVQVHRKEHGLKAEQTPAMEKLDAWWSEVLGELGTEVALIGPAYVQGYMRDSYWGQARPQWPFHGFIAQWRNYVPNRTHAAAR